MASSWLTLGEHAACCTILQHISLPPSGALTACLLLAVCIPSESSPSLSDVITSRDTDRLSKVLHQAPLADLQTAYSVASGLKLIAKESSDSKQVSHLMYPPLPAVPPLPADHERINFGIFVNARDRAFGD